MFVDIIYKTFHELTTGLGTAHWWVKFPLKVICSLPFDRHMAFVDVPPTSHLTVWTQFPSKDTKLHVFVLSYLQMTTNHEQTEICFNWVRSVDACSRFIAYSRYICTIVTWFWQPQVYTHHVYSRFRLAEAAAYFGSASKLLGEFAKAWRS